MSVEPRTLPPPAEHAFPDDWGTRARWRAQGTSGLRYGEISPELARALPRWLAERRVAGGEPVKPPGVFRAGGLVIKFFPPPSVFGLLRTPRALRSAERYFQLLPIPSPRPLVALTEGRGGWSMLAREYLEGQLLHEAWHDAEAAGELPRFLAAMRRQGALHGDLHPRNLIWTDRRWMLLDVDGLRHGLHSQERVALSQWARLLVHLADEPGLERAYAAYLGELGSDAAGASPWPRIVRRARDMQRARDERSERT
jgi:tRNA A-37 threonylcarbamoyl transferase component Bud32